MFERFQVSRMTTLAILTAIGFTVCLIVLSNSGNNVAEENPIAAPRVMKTGGLGETRAKDDEVVLAVAKIKPILEEKTNTKYESIEVVNYRHQVVAGKNYFVKAKLRPVGDGAESFAHLRIYRDLGNNYELTNFQLDKKEQDELKYFQ